MAGYYIEEGSMIGVDETLAKTPEPGQHWEIVRDRMNNSKVLLKLWDGSLLVDSEDLFALETYGIDSAVQTAATAIWARREIDKYTGIYPRKDTN